MVDTLVVNQIVNGTTVEEKSTVLSVNSPVVQALVVEADPDILAVNNAVVQTVVVESVGAPGPQGPPGTDGFQFVYSQMTPTAVWDIAHHLNGFPSVTVVDSADNVVIGDVHYVSNNEITITFSGAFSGSAYFS